MDALDKHGFAYTKLIFSFFHFIYVRGNCIGFVYGCKASHPFSFQGGVACKSIEGVLREYQWRFVRPIFRNASGTFIRFICLVHCSIF